MIKSLNYEYDDYYCIIECKCGRKFRPEDMYICYVCKEIKCQYCTRTEGQLLQCKAGCSNQYTTAAKTKNVRFCCQNCLECPLCFTPVTTKTYMDKFYLSCPSCYWNSLKAHIVKGKKDEFDKYIKRMNEETCNGYLKRMYNVLLKQLSDDALILNRPKKQLDLEDRINKSTYSDIVQKAMNTEEQNFSNFEKNSKNESEAEEKKETGKIEYNDDYINNEENKYVSLKIINKILPCYNDYTQTFNTLEEVQKAFNTNDLSFNAMTGLEQRHNNPVLQNISILNQYPKFVDLIPKKNLFNKTCKQCKKLIVEEIDDNHKKEGRINHSFISQLPIVLINKIDVEQSLIKLRFIMLNFIDNINISFKNDPYSKVKVVLPEEKFDFELKEGEEGSKSNIRYKNVLIDFKFDESYKSELVKDSSHILRFIVRAEFNRIESQNESQDATNAIEYPTEIKFKIK